MNMFFFCCCIKIVIAMVMEIVKMYLNRKGTSVLLFL